jgi:hypothetical protein
MTKMAFASIERGLQQAIRHRKGITRESLVLLKILVLGRRQVEEGKAIPLAEAIRKRRARRARR